MPPTIQHAKLRAQQTEDLHETEKCEYCGTEFDAALSQCPLCGKRCSLAQPSRKLVMPAAYKPAGGRGGKFSKKKGGHFAADPKKEKRGKNGGKSL